MQSLFEIKSKRLISIALITIFDLAQIFFILKLDVESSDLAVRGYSFSFTDDLALNNITIFYLIFAPLLFSYLGIINNASRPDLIQVVGPKSLLNAVDIAFSTGSFSNTEKTDNNINLYFEELARGEPPGTIDNLKLLYSIGNLVTNLVQESGVKSIKRVYVSDRDIANAFTLRVIPIPFIGQDWIIVNRNLLEILKPQEVKAVLAHEVGHAARFDSWLNTFISVPKWIIIFGWSIVFFKMTFIIFREGLAGFTIYRLVSIFLFFVVIRLLLNITQFLTDMFRRNSELLADHYAAEMMGSEILINALLKIARRAEVINSVQKDLEWLIGQNDQIHPNMYLQGMIGQISPTELSSKNVRRDVIRSYASFKLRDTLNGLRMKLPEDDINRLINESCEKLNEILQKQDSMIQVQKPFSIENWREVDIDGDEYLSKNEIVDLANKLRDSTRIKYDPKTMETMGIVLESPSHPHINNRIIFINDSIIIKELSNK